MAKHSLALRAIVAARGRVDPGALVLRVQGLRAFINLPRIVRLLAARQNQPISRLFSDRRPPPPMPRGASSAKG